MKRLTLYCLVIFSYVTSSLALPPPKQVVVRTVRTRHLELDAYLATQVRSTSYAQYLFEIRTPSESASQLRSQFLLAQKAYFGTDRKSAIFEFQKVLAMRLSNQWTAIEQKALLFSALRIYELSEQPAAKQKALKIALSLGDPDDLDQTVFSPDTVSVFAQEWDRLGETTLPVTGWMKHYEILAYGGQKISLKGKTRIEIKDPEEKFLFSFYSSSVEPFEIVSNLNEMISLKPTPTALLDQNCKLETQLELPMIAIDQTSFCQGPDQHSIARKGNLKALKAKKGMSSQKPLSLNRLKPERPELKPSRLQIKPVSTTDTKAEKKWWRNKWLWIGIGAVATSAAIYSQQNNSSSGKKDSTPRDVQPTKTYED